MKRKTIFKMRNARYLGIVAMPLLAANPAFAVTYNLLAGATSFTPPGSSTPIPMWGFGCADQLCVDAAGGNAAIGQPTVPGPALKVPAGDSTLIINLTNNLPATGSNPAEPVSIVIDGLPMPTGSAPVYVNDDNGTPRVRSLTKETAPGQSVTYTWTGVKPGTFLYRSGTHMQVQDQMGLYGALNHDAAAGQAYASIDYDKDVTLLYSEIDPLIHNAVALGKFGNNPPSGTCTAPVSAPKNLPAGWVCSTIHYEPKYFLINGQPYSGVGSNEFAAGVSGQKTLIRFLNAGLQTHVPVLNGADMTLVAEDGNPYPYAKTQYSAFLPAMKTIDAILTPTIASGGSLKLPVVDRMLNLSNNGAASGGMLAYLTVSAGVNNAPKFDQVGCLPGPLNVAIAGSANCGLVAHSTVSPAPLPAPTFTYELVTAPAYVSLAGNVITAAPQSGDVDSSVTVKATDSSNGVSSTASFTVNITDNTPPTFTSAPAATANVGVAYSYSATASDADVPAQTLNFTAVSVPAGMTVTSAGQISWTPTAGQTGAQQVKIRVTDSGSPALFAEQSFTVTVSKNTAPSINSTPVTNATVGVPYSYSLMATDADVPAQTLAYAKVSGPAWLSINSNGVLSGTPPVNSVGNRNVTLRVTDNGLPAMFAEQSFTIVVVANTPPLVGNDVYTVLRNSVNNPLTILSNDSDSNGLNPSSVVINSLPSGWSRTVNAGQASYSKAVRFTASTCTNKFANASVVNGACVMPANQYVLPKQGLATVDVSGVVNYKPALNFLGTESFGYSVADSLGLTANGTVKVNVKR